MKLQPNLSSFFFFFFFLSYLNPTSYLKYFNEQFPNYLREVFNVTMESNVQLKSSFQKLKCPFRKTDNGKFTLPYIGPTF